MDEKSKRKNQTPNDAEFSDPRLVALYDILNPIGEDTHFYIELAAQLSAKSIIDVGCGTGLLAIELAKRGHQVIGLDPASTMLRFAKQHPLAEQVQWITGDASQLNEHQAKLVTMTGHVAQFFLDDESWNTTLEAIHKALFSGGYLAFESRNPLVKAWTQWTKERTRRKIETDSDGVVEFWSQFINIKDNRVRYKLHYIFTETGEELVATNELRFRTQEEIVQSLKEAGFSIENIFGDWDHSPVHTGSRELIFLAKRL